MMTDNFRKHTSINPLQRFLVERFYRVIITELKRLHPERILDAGCGEGFMLKRLSDVNIGTALVGVDANLDAVRLGRAIHPLLDLREGSIYKLPFADGSFDTVMCLEVLEHLERPEDALRELRRVAARYVIISVPHEPYFRIANFLRGKNISRWGNDVEHIQHWSARGISELVGKHFIVQEVRNPFPWTIVVGEKA